MIAFIAQWLIVVPALLVLAAIVMRRVWKSDLLEAVIAGIATIVVVKIAGSLYVERRPFLVEHVQPLVPHAPDNAFPSDHLAACGLAFAYLWPRSKPLAIATLACAGAIAYARVVAHLHWPLDVTAGFVLGAAATLVMGAFMRRFAARGLPFGANSL